MKSFAELSSKSSLAKPAPLLLPAPTGVRLWLWLFAAVAFVGFLDATFLTVKHYTGGVIPCSILNGCDLVTRSVYATVGTVPLALLGSTYYLFILIAVLVYRDWPNRAWLDFVTKLTVVGLLTSLWLVYLQIFVLRALCLYCLVSAASSTTLFILALLIRRRIKLSAAA